MLPPADAKKLGAVGQHLSLSEAMTLSYYKNLEQLIMNQVKRLDIIKRLKQKAPIHQSFKIQLQKEVNEYYKNTTQLKAKINKPPQQGQFASAFKNQSRGQLEGIFQLKNMDPEEIIVQANRKYAAGCFSQPKAHNNGMLCQNGFAHHQAGGLNNDLWNEGQPLSGDSSTKGGNFT